MDRNLAAAQLVWCLLFLLLRRAFTRQLGMATAIALTAVGGLLPRLLYVLGTMGTVWMLDGLARISVIATYTLTGLWIVFLGLLAKPNLRKLVGKCAVWMTVLAIVEAVGAANTAVGALQILLRGGEPPWLGAAIAMIFAVTQVLFLLSIARDADPPPQAAWRDL